MEQMKNKMAKSNDERKFDEVNKKIVNYGKGGRIELEIVCCDIEVM